MRPLTMLMAFSFMAPFVGCSVVLTGWIVDRDPPVIHDKYWVEPKVVEPCETIEFFVQRYALRQAAVKVNLILRDSKNQTYAPDIPESPELRGAIGEDTFSIPIQVPCSFKSGVASLEHRYQFKRNPLQAESGWPIRLPAGRVSFCVKADDDRGEVECKKAGLN